MKNKVPKKPIIFILNKIKKILISINLLNLIKKKILQMKKIIF
jgi:hypothetical protein